MSNDKKLDQVIQGHEYDGIQEFDNPLPGWWLATFYGTIIFAVIYYIQYTFLGAASLQEEFDATMKEYNANKPAVVLLTEDELISKITPATIEEGKAVFSTRCVPCHGEKAGGLIGPNLTDNFWINGQGTRSDIYKVVTQGVLEKGMPPWGESLKPNELLAVVGFVHSLQGTNTPGGKPPQGNEVKK